MEEDVNVQKKPKRKIPTSAYVIVAILIILAGAYSYYMSLPDKYANDGSIATPKCVDLCVNEQSKGRILSEGPCLADEIVPGWACDVVHIPRVGLIDNKEQNQCQSYVNKKVRHFVEVDTECKFVIAK